MGVEEEEGGEKMGRKGWAMNRLAGVLPATSMIGE